MARKYEMSWEGPPAFRWVKMFKGVRYRVTCVELKATVWTKEGSVHLANEWWREKRAEIDLPQDMKMTVLAAVQDNLDENNAMLGMMIKRLGESVTAPVTREAVSEAVAALPDVSLAERVAGKLSVTAERTVGNMAEMWVGLEAGRLQAGKVGQARANMNKVCLGHFRDWIGDRTAVTAIKGVKWAEWYAFLASRVNDGTWAVSHADRIFAVSKRFVRYLWEVELIDLPRNLDSKNLSFTIAPTEITTWTNEEIAKLLMTTTGQSRLHIYLMLNCGFIGQDVNDLRHDEVDWKAGIITRKRSKTRTEKNVRVVRYNLWPETFRLLQEHCSTDPTTVLLTTTSRRWIEERTDATGYHRSDKIQSNLKYWMKREGIKKPPKALRATAASKLAEHPQYKFYSAYFLGHSPRSVADKHYVKPNDHEFFAALEWLRTALGVA